MAFATDAHKIFKHKNVNSGENAFPLSGTFLNPRSVPH